MPISCDLYSLLRGYNEYKFKNSRIRDLKYYSKKGF